MSCSPPLTAGVGEAGTHSAAGPGPGAHWGIWAQAGY